MVSHPITGAYRRWVEAIVRRPRLSATLLFLAAIPAAYLTALYFMNVHAGLQDLLPADAPSVRAIEKLHARLGGVSNLIVIAHSDDAEANRAFAGKLAERIRAAKIPELKSLRADIREERSWLQDRAALLLDQASFDDTLERLEDAITDARMAENPLYVPLDGDKDGPEKALTAIADDLQARAKKLDRFPNGLFETSDGKMVVLIVGLAGSELDIGPSRALADGIMAEVAALRGEFPESRVGVALNGEVQNLIEEHAAIVSDVSLSSSMVTILVGLLIGFYFRSARAVAVVVGSLTPGILLTFAIGRVSGSTLNSNSAFLGSIIAGNGINYILLLLAFYRGRPEGEDPADAIVGAARAALPGTLGAAVTASAAYFGLAAADFRGFSDFGRLGGVGMVTTWTITYVVAPILIANIRPPRRGEAPTAAQHAWERSFASPWLPRVVAGSLVAVTLGVAGYGAFIASRDGLYDMNLLNLRNQDSLRTGGASWDRRMSGLFGVWMNPVVGLVGKVEDREVLATALRSALIEGDAPMAERVETIERYVPPLAEQQRRIERLQALRSSIDRVPRERLPEKAREATDRWLAPKNLVPITPDEVPQALRSGFAEKDGRIDSTVLLFPALGIDFDDGANVVRFADRLNAATFPEGAVVAGGFLFMAEILRMVRDEAPKVILTVCFLVALVLVPIYWRKPLRIVLVVGTVAIVAVLAQSVMFAAGVRLNMLNFAAIPITVGVGSDYVVNLIGGMDAMKASAQRAVARLGGAILLCSATTTVGYLSLLLAHSGALRSFGWAAVLGEVMAVTVVLVVLPVVWGAREPRQDE